MGTEPLLRFATFLAPSMFAVYQAVAEYVGAAVGRRVTLRVGDSFAAFAEGRTDIGFICGLPYVQLMRQVPAPVHLLAAPVLADPRCGDHPIYYSDVIVRRGSPYQDFADLRGARWAYNDCDSHSGYNLTRYHLMQRGETQGFFGAVLEAGWHQRAIAWVDDGVIDAAAIDSQVLAIALRDDPALAARLRVIATLGPSTIQPVVAARHVPTPLQAAVRAALLAMAADPAARAALAAGFITRFAPVADSTYDDIRAMLHAAESAAFLTLR